MTLPWQKAYGAAIHIVERKWLKNAAAVISRRFESTAIVNIGVFQCASMYCFRAGAPRARIVGVDLVHCPVSIHPELKAKFLIGNSRKCHTKFEGPIHLLFIDGDHRYASVKADIANWTPKIPPGGIVVFHDYAPTRKQLIKHKLQGVRKAIDEWVKPAAWKRLSAVGSLAAFQRQR